LLSYAALAPAIGRRWAVAVAALLGANPVALAQVCSFYVDGMAAALITALAALHLLCARAERPRVPLLLAQAAALVLLANLQFTGVVYAVAAGALHVGLRARAGGSRPALRRAALTTALALAGGVLLVGYDPYVTNTVRKGH